MWFQKLSLLPPQKGLEIPGRRGGGGGGSQRPKNLKECIYEAKLEFLEGWGVLGQIPSMGGMDIF